MCNERLFYYQGSETSTLFHQVGGNSTMNMNGAHAPPSEDRYAALKDLDSLMKQTQLKEETTATLSAPTWNANNSNGAYSAIHPYVLLSVEPVD